MKIEVGKFYLTRDGEVVEIRGCRNGGAYPFKASNHCTYAENGHYLNCDIEAGYDLVEEVEEQVIRVTPVEDSERKEIRLDSIFKFFPDACIELSRHIKRGADKYCDGEIRWDRSKSPEEIASLMRHVMDQVHDVDNTDIAAAIAWRGMANLQKVIERNNNK
jgi:hypothetical protein